MTHTIILSRPFYNTLQDLNYACYTNKKYAFRFDNLRDRYDFLLKNNFVTREQCTPEFMETCINFFTPDWCLKQFIKILGEDDIPESIKISIMQHDNQGGALGLLKHPSNAVIDAALKSAGQAIKYVKKPTRHQKLLAIQYSTESPELIIKIEKPTIQMQKIHVSKYINGIDYIETPNEQVKLAAAKSHGIWVLKQKNMQHASEQVILTAIQYTLSPELKSFLMYIPHPNQKIMCAIRHQINMVKTAQQQWEIERANTQNQHSCEDELDFLRRAILGFGHLEEVIQIENKYYRDPAAQIKALTALYEQTRTNPFIERHNQEILHPQRS